MFMFPLKNLARKGLNNILKLVSMGQFLQYFFFEMWKLHNLSGFKIKFNHKPEKNPTCTYIKQKRKEKKVRKKKRAKMTKPQIR